MRRPWLIALFLVLLALDARSVIEPLYARRHFAVERLIDGSTLYWSTWVLVILFDLGILWLTVRVAKSLRGPASATPQTEARHEQ
jgi:hypothetical protein